MKKYICIYTYKTFKELKVTSKERYKLKSMPFMDSGPKICMKVHVNMYKNTSGRLIYKDTKISVFKMNMYTYNLMREVIMITCL
jgi:uncharacterized protein YpuA (DUF1002 family)